MPLLCQRCRARHKEGEPLTLIGGVHTTLCDDCRTEFHEYTHSMEEFKGLLSITARKVYLERAAEMGMKEEVTEDKILRILVDEYEILRKLHTLVKKFVESGERED